MDILSEQEKKVLEQVGRLYTNKEIAEELGISVRTVHKHKENICKKIGVSGRGALAKWYFHNGNGMNGMGRS